MNHGRPPESENGSGHSPAGDPGYHKLFESIDTGYCVIEVLFDTDGRARDYVFLEANPAFEKQTGLAGAAGKSMRTLAPGHEEFWFETYGLIARTGQAERFEHRADSLGRWFDVYATRVGEPGQHRVAIVFSDISDRKQAEATLRESEERQAFLLKLSDELRPLADPGTIKAAATRLLGEHLAVNRLFYADAENDHWLVTKGFEREIEPLPDTPFAMSTYGDWIIDMFRAGNGLIVDDMMHDRRFNPSERSAHDALQIGAEVALPLVKGGELLAMLVAHDRSPRIWTALEVSLIEATAERTWSAVERARAEAAARESAERQRVLVAELQHRVRNILSVVRSVFTRTVDAGGSVEDIADHFRGRLDALARTQVGLTRNSSGAVDLENMIRDELVSVAADADPALTIDGPDVALPASAAEAFGLAIHELTTNSIKYGALRFPKARLTIRWSLNVDYGAEPRLVFSWLEEGVPAISMTPRRQGFGTELITRALPYRLGAQTSLELLPGGVHCTIELPLNMSKASPLLEDA